MTPKQVMEEVLKGVVGCPADRAKTLIHDNIRQLHDEFFAKGSDSVSVKETPGGFVVEGAFPYYPDTLAEFVALIVHATEPRYQIAVEFSISDTP